MKQKLLALSLLLTLVLCSASCGKSSSTQASADLQNSSSEQQTGETQPIGSDSQSDTYSTQQAVQTVTDAKGNTVTVVAQASTTKSFISGNTTKKPVTNTTKKASTTKKTFQPITTAADGTVTINGTKYKETFFDDFNGTQLDKSKWAICPEWTRHEGNVWRKDMVKLDGKGNLLVLCDKLSGTTYKSGGVRSRDLFYQAYGYFEIRCELQKSPGFWGAFWLMPDSIDDGIKGGSDGTEIDIFESAYLSSEKINHALHWDGYGSNHKSVGTQVTVPGSYKGFHTYALEWTKDAYRFYIDGTKTYEVNSSQVDICTKELYMKITTEAGSWAGKCDDSKLPDGITVDYVRVFQKK